MGQGEVGISRKIYLRKKNLITYKDDQGSAYDVLQFQT